MTHQLVSLTIAFTVEDEEAVDLGDLIAEIELALRQLDGVDGACADVLRSVRRYSVLAELEGHDPDCEAAKLAMEEAVRKLAPRASRVLTGAPAIVEELDD